MSAAAGPHLPRGAEGLRAGDLQQRGLSHRPLHAPRVLRAVGAGRVDVPQDLRESPLLVRAAEAPEPLDEEGVRPGVQGVRLPVRARPPEEGSGLVSARGAGQAEAAQEGAPEQHQDSGAAGAETSRREPFLQRLLQPLIRRESHPSTEQEEWKGRVLL